MEVDDKRLAAGDGLVHSRLRRSPKQRFARSTRPVSVKHEEGGISKGKLRRPRSKAGVSVPWSLAIPALLIAIAINWLGSIAGVYYSFTNWSGIGQPEFIGLDNYVNVVVDPDNFSPLVHTFEYAIPYVVISNVGGLLLALGLNRAVRTRNFLRMLYFAPFAVSPLAVSYIWAYVFAGSGPLNALVQDVGAEPVNWLGQAATAKAVIVLVMVWQSVGMTMVIYLAGLTGVPPELEESAMVDGATAFQRFRYVQMPLLAPAVTICATLTCIQGLRVFDEILALTGGGPNGATANLATEVYQEAFVLGHYGYASALAVILTVLVAIVSITQLLLLRRREVQF